MLFDFKINDKFIITWLSLCAFLHNILMNGTNNVIISSLQKEFYLSSRETGVYVSVYDIGSLCSSILISFAAARGSKPRWIAFGMIMLFVGCMINVLPHFIKPDHSSQKKFSNSSHVINSDDIVELCNYSLSTQNHQADVYFPRNYTSPASPVDQTKTASSSIFGFQVKYLLYIANIVNGLSSASMTTITFSYIEDFAPSKKLSSVYESIYFVMGAFGVGVGFMITSWCLKIHTDIDRMKELPFWLNPSHPNWIGAWWIPFLAFGIVAFFMAIVITFFPQKIHNQNAHQKLNDLSQLNGTEKKSDKPAFDSLNTDIEVVDNDLDLQERDYEDSKFLSALKNAGSILSIDRVNHDMAKSESILSLEKQSLLEKTLCLFKKPAYILVVICAAIEGLLQNSFLAFAALFLEYQYRLASGSASLVIGILSMPPLIIGGLVSSLIVNKFKSDTRKCLKFIAMVLFVNIFIYAGFMIFCKEPNMVSIEESLNYEHAFTVAEDCNCNKKMFKPVCLKGSNDTFFQSACLAGCFYFDKEKEVYNNCTQVPSSFGEPNTSYFINGLCPTDSSCSLRLVVSYVCIFLLMLMNALTFLPFLKAAIGCIDNEEMNSIGLGFKQFFMNAFGTIPGPIIFGSVIDSTCIYWHDDVNDQSVCKLYNNEKFAFGFGVLGVGFKTVCFILIVLSIRFAKKQQNTK
ncbi:solute carrier organic anion transporter family member 1A2 isoform X1 [Brachionus plicatilis]|uniref:Solute carrier organic anion transporter family member n=1 Tax=Brachionus plicatilis TaxID=10195 RepID=A0A3M7RSU4_BRAPC|nr:solute carrier organic anion transporter family member 1A2 isoform X1 [Brachionus plicatilis]